MHYSDDLWAAQMVRELVIRAIEGVADELTLVAKVLREQEEGVKEPPPAS